MVRQKYHVKVPSDDPMSEETAYWLGFLLADGNLRRQGNRSWQTRINLAQRDRHHLKAFLDFLNSDYPIYEFPQTNACGVVITSEALGELLLKYGITPAKSKIVTVDNRLAKNRHFWRGVFDGDGWLSQDCNRFSLVGTYDVCSKFSNYLDLGLTPKQDGPNLYVVATSGRKAKLVARTLYNNTSIALERKASLARRI